MSVKPASLGWLDPSCVLCIDFDDGSCKDRSYCLNNGGSVGAEVVVGRKNSGGMNFSGNGQYIEMTPLAVKLDWTRDWTFSCWASMKAGTTNAWRGLFSTRGINCDAAGWIEFGTKDTGVIIVEFGPSGASINTTFNPTGNGWQFYTLTKLNTTVSIYINGLLSVSGSTVGRNLGSSSNELQIGKWCIAAQAWNGTIDEVYLFSRAFSNIEIRQLYEEGLN